MAKNIKKENQIVRKLEPHQQYMALFAYSRASRGNAYTGRVCAILSLSYASVTIILTGSLIIWAVTSFTPIPISEQREHYMHEQVCRIAGVRWCD